MRSFILALSAIALLACEPVDFKLKAGLDGSLADSSSADSSDGSKDAADSAEAGVADVASTPADVAAAQPTADVAVVNPPCTDTDKDGYCDKAVKPDCNDLDSSINPGATEVCGNGKDDNCDNSIDEGCTAPTGPNTLTVTYTSALTRVLNVQVTTNKADLGGLWQNGSPTSTGSSVMKDLGTLAAAPCTYVRFSVSEGDPATKWSCMGNGSTAQMDANATPSLKLWGQTYDKTKLITWSAPGGTNAGCSGLFVVPGTGSTVASCGY